MYICYSRTEKLQHYQCHHYQENIFSKLKITYEAVLCHNMRLPLGTVTRSYLQKTDRVDGLKTLREYLYLGTVFFMMCI